MNMTQYVYASYIINVSLTGSHLSAQTEWFSFCPNITSRFHNIATVSYRTTEIKLVGMSVIFFSTKFCFFKCSSSWVISIKQNVNFKIHPLSTFVFFFFHKNGFTNTKFNGFTLTGSSFIPTSEVSGMVEATRFKSIGSRSPLMFRVEYNENPQTG
jgi:hypothetical protein